MTTPRNLSVSVENFGPVREGKFELSPLTIFIGPNNSGKSYMALLVYALSEALLGRVHGKYAGRFWHADPARWSPSEMGQPTAWVAKHHGARPHQFCLDDMPENLSNLLKKVIRHAVSVIEREIEEVLRDYFGCASVQELTRKGNGSEALAIRLNESEGRAPLLRVSMATQGARPRVQATFQMPESLVLGNFGRSGAALWGEPPAIIGLPDLVWAHFLGENGVAKSAYYLPAARSGILQGWQLFASMAVQALRQRVGLERIEVPPFTGVAGDFLQVLWERVMQRHPARRERVAEQMSPVLRVLEEEVFAGEVSLEAGGRERGLILYKSKRLRLPLNRASSMVAELAPLVLWIKYLLEPGDLLIIDEPEAHLHPENQRRVARALVRLVRAGVRVLCTTHSSTILHQVSNHVLAREASSRTRKELGFSAEDLLDANNVGVYLFDVQEDGTHISPVPVEPGFGIPEDEFVKVSEAIGDETYRLTAPTHK